MNTPFLLLLGSLMLTAADVPVQTTYVLSREYAVTIQGTSNVRNWQENVGEVTGDMVAGLNEDGSVTLTMIHIKMQVHSIKSDLGAGMDKRTYEALRADTYPAITFLLNAPVKLVQVKPGTITRSVKGSLTLAGICRPVTMQVSAFTLAEGKMQFEGIQAIRMTDYGVRPPTALFGTIKADADITIHFKTNFTIKQS